MEKLKDLFNKYKEIIMYLVFGVLTTVVGVGSYLIFVEIGAAIGFCDAMGEPTNGLRVVANVLQWILAVLFAFFTNKKWVFEESGKGSFRLLCEFASSRVITLILDTVLTVGTASLLAFLSYKQIWIFTPDLIAKCVASVFVVIGNYVLSKLWVFKKGKN